LANTDGAAGAAEAAEDPLAPAEANGEGEDAPADANGEEALAAKGDGFEEKLEKVACDFLAGGGPLGASA